MSDSKIYKAVKKNFLDLMPRDCFCSMRLVEEFSEELELGLEPIKMVQQGIPLLHGFQRDRSK